MRKHNIDSPSDLKTVLQLAKQCWKEGRDFPEERLPRVGDSKGRPRTRKVMDYQVGGGFRPHTRGTMAYSRVRRAMSLWIAMDLPPLCHCRHACIVSHVTRFWTRKPRIWAKRVSQLRYAYALLSTVFHVHSLSPYFLVANAVGVAGQITRLYNLGVERLKNEEDWARVRPSIHLRLVEVSDEQGVFYLHGALGAGQSMRGAEVETASGDDLRGAGGDNIHSR